MKAPPLVFYDQVAIGPVRFELYGHAPLARQYLHAGRVQLGQMKAQTGVYGLQEEGGLVATGGTGFWNMSQTMPDGTVIKTIHNDGQDTVRITAPFPPPTEPKNGKKTQDFMGTFLGACGDYGGSDTGEQQPWVWKDGEGYDYPRIDGSTGTAWSIAWTADAVCGLSVDAEDPEGDYNFLWRRGANGGTTENIGDKLTYGIAKAIAGDGTLVATDKGWYWRKESGWVQVELNDIASGPNEKAAAAIFCVGGDGTVMAGWIGVDNGFGGYFRRPCIWRGDGVGFGATVLDDGDATWQTHQEAFPAGWTPGRYEGHTYIPQDPPVDFGAGIGTLQEPLEPFTYYDAVDSFGNTVKGYDITHHNGGCVTGVRYDASAACGYIAIQDEGTYTQVAVWGSDHALRILGLPPGFLSAQASGINQSGDAVISGYGQKDNGDTGWFIWSETTGFVVIDLPAQGNCITQAGDITGGLIYAEPENLVTGTPCRYDIDGASLSLTTFDPPPSGGCYGITSVSITVDAFGVQTFEPPMPGLSLDLSDIELWPLSERDDYT